VLACIAKDISILKINELNQQIKNIFLIVRTFCTELNLSNVVEAITNAIVKSVLTINMRMGKYGP
jgi:transcription initiation factor TFIIIB Brf1 subunit/transcription initiation factor TFIIB